MTTYKSTKSVNRLIKDIKKKEILLDHPVQREEGQFSRLQKSLLIDSILRDYPIPAIYLLEENGNTYVIDGLQRLSILRDFTDYKFSLSSSLEDFDYEKLEDDGTTTTCSCKLARKKYDKLPTEVQDIIKEYEFAIYTLSDCTDEEVNEIFSRLNNGVPLNTAQKLRTSIGKELRNSLDDIKATDFFTKTAPLPEKQKLRGLEDTCIIQILMLNKGLKNFGTASIKKFITNYEFDSADFDNIKTALDELSAGIKKNLDGLGKITIPLVVATYMTCDDKNKDIFISQANEFFEDYASQTDYTDLCKSNTSSEKNITDRLAIIEGWK